ncbi:MAG: leucine-rich repeat domain-containing protein [Lachnospiraceae bacterium]|nr:leucine-rich repeat domain-containing protein [Lachnospiraceae bacterium]
MVIKHKMQIRETDTENGSLQYKIQEDYAILIEYRGRDISLTIPECVDGKLVTVIGKKAFLGAKSLQKLVLPEGIMQIQDWAFAFCSNLESLTLPRKKLDIGQGIMKDCFRLRQIIIAEGDPEAEGISYLLAAVMNKLEAFYLFDPSAAGSRSWLEQWDARLLSLMEQEDTEGFSKMLLCGEEDYGSKDNNLDYYVEQRRRFKVRISMLRLIYDIGLQPSVRNKLLSYLQSHKKGESSEETWKVVLEEHGDDRRYYQFLLDNDCITEENFDAVLSDMGERHTEMKAFLMNEQSTRSKREDAFEALKFEL